MKIRISEQSLRVRLSSEEATALNEGETLRTNLRLNAIDTFEVILQPWHLAIGEVHAEAEGLRISIPTEAARRLALEHDYIFTERQPADSAHPLVISIEIDLQKKPQP
jgi:hypothetical protein